MGRNVKMCILYSKLHGTFHTLKHTTGYNTEYSYIVSKYKMNRKYMCQQDCESHKLHMVKEEMKTLIKYLCLDKAVNGTYITKSHII
jgi:hypothetical protein